MEKNMERPINMESIKMVGLFIWKNMERPKKNMDGLCHGKSD